CLMLVGAGLIGRSLWELERIDAGIDVSNVLTARLSLNFTKYNTGNARRLMANTLLARLNGLPGVSSFALASTLPLNNGTSANQAFTIDGVSTATGVNGPHTDFAAVSGDYFHTVGIPVVRGRTFAAADRDTFPLVAIVSRRLASAYWGNRDPIGTRISTDSGRHWTTEVGVVGDVRQNRLDAD